LTGLPDNSICPAAEKCGRYIWKSSSNNPLAYLDACILQKYCGINGAELTSGAAGGTYTYSTDFTCPDTSGSTAPAAPECFNGQVLVGNDC